MKLRDEGYTSLELGAIIIPSAGKSKVIDKHLLRCLSFVQKL